MPSSSGLKTPKTPQDEALAFFSQTSHAGAEPVQVWELELEDDGGPALNKSASPMIIPNHALITRDDPVKNLLPPRRGEGHPM